MSTAVIWLKSKPDVELEYGRRLGVSSQSHLPHCRVLPLGEFNGMSSQSHVSHWRVLPLGEFTVMIPWAACHTEGCSHLAKSMSWSCHIAGCNNSIRHVENRLSPYFIFIFWFFNAVWALTWMGFGMDRRLSYRLRYTCWKVWFVDNISVVLKISGEIW